MMQILRPANKRQTQSPQGW